MESVTLVLPSAALSCVSSPGGDARPCQQTVSRYPPASLERDLESAGVHWSPLEPWSLPQEHLGEYKGELSCRTLTGLDPRVTSEID